MNGWKRGWPGLGWVVDDFCNRERTPTSTRATRRTDDCYIGATKRPPHAAEEEEEDTFTQTQTAHASVQEAGSQFGSIAAGGLDRAVLLQKERTTTRNKVCASINKQIQCIRAGGEMPSGAGVL